MNTRTPALWFTTLLRSPLAAGCCAQAPLLSGGEPGRRVAGGILTSRPSDRGGNDAWWSHLMEVAA